MTAAHPSDPHEFPEIERLCLAAAEQPKPLLLVFAPNSATAYASTAERTTMMRALREFLAGQARLS